MGFSCFIWVFTLQFICRGDKVNKLISKCKWWQTLKARSLDGREVYLFVCNYWEGSPSLWSINLIQRCDGISQLHNLSVPPCHILSARPCFTLHSANIDWELRQHHHWKCPPPCQECPRLSFKILFRFLRSLIVIPKRYNNVFVFISTIHSSLCSFSPLLQNRIVC